MANHNEIIDEFFDEEIEKPPRYEISVFGVIIGTADGDNSADGEVEIKFYNFQHSNLFDPHIPNCDTLGINFQSGEIVCYTYEAFSEGNATNTPVKMHIDTQFFLQMLCVATARKL